MSTPAHRPAPRATESMDECLVALLTDKVLGYLVGVEMARTIPRGGYFNGLSAVERRPEIRARLRRFARHLKAGGSVEWEGAETARDPGTGEQGRGPR